jgi:hypothetical protein
MQGQPVNAGIINRIRTAPGILSAIGEGKKIGRTLHVQGIGTDGLARPIHELRGAIEVAHTMIGRKRLDNLHACLDTIHSDHVPGDLIETGVWRGGATIFMCGWMMAHEIEDRLVWAADSFDGLPVPRLPQDQGVDLSKNTNPFLAVSRAEVEDLFRRYDLLDDRVRFLEGWFRDTLPTAPIERLALLRLDGDLYESTMDALKALYHKVSTGGFVIVDDYYTNPTCKAAIQDFRDSHGVDAPMIDIDSDALYWRVPRG